MAKKIIRRLSHSFKVEGHKVSVGISMGITITPSDGEEVIVLIKNADQAMYKAKNAGRNTFRFFSKEFDKRIFAQTSSPYLVL
ncbi:MAG TPA: diguanylate cyclase [Nitrospiria bacterium]|nr:diguanylate cyclase [Candidatus Manganitrophaceae bacterium]HIL34437.1 diguanylate cyclase [Candidatus Manganitrophaceae bacterium]